MPERSPPVPARPAWARTMGQAAYWRPLIGRILRKHGLRGGPIRPGRPGCHAVFLVGPDLVVKLLAPYDFGPSRPGGQGDYATELWVHELLARNSAIPAPELRAHGYEGGWPYLVTTRVRGRPIAEALHELSAAELRPLVAQVGRLMRAIYELPVAESPMDWTSFMSRRIGQCAERQRSLGSLPEPLARQIPELLAAAQPIPAAGFRPRLIHADISADHVFVVRRHGAWQVTGLIDFGDAMVGEPEYDLVAPGLDIVRGDAEVLRVLLDSAGYAPAPETDASRRLLAYTLLHRFVDLADVPWWQNSGEPGSLEELAERLWPVQ